jgi:hypothetical protein
MGVSAGSAAEGVSASEHTDYLVVLPEGCLSSTRTLFHFKPLSQGHKSIDMLF